MSNFSKFYRGVLENLEQSNSSHVSPSPLSLFVWEDAISKYEDSLVCVLAHNEEEAWELLRGEDGYTWSILQGKNRYNNNIGAIKSPIQVKSPKAFTCLGNRN